MSINLIFSILGVMTPYLVMVITLSVQSYQKKKKEIPIIRCSVKPYPVYECNNAILIFKNISDYNAMNFCVEPELEIYTQKYVSTKRNILFPNEKMKYIFPISENLDEVTIRYTDIHKRRHFTKYRIRIKEQGDIASDLQCEIIVTEEA